MVSTSAMMVSVGEFQGWATNSKEATSLFFFDCAVFILKFRFHLGFMCWTPEPQATKES